jgi:hypothetical protein
LLILSIGWRSGISSWEDLRFGSSFSYQPGPNLTSWRNSSLLLFLIFKWHLVYYLSLKMVDLACWNCSGFKFLICVVDRYNFVQTHQTFNFWWHVAFSYWDWNFLICPYQSYSIKKNLENKISIFVDASNISCLWLWHAISSKSFSLVANQATTNSLISSGEACQWFTVTNNSVKVSFRTTGELLRQTSAILFIVYYAMLSFEIYRGFPIWNGN